MQEPEWADRGDWLTVSTWMAAKSSDLLGADSSLRVVEEDFSITSPLESLGSQYGQWLTFWTVIPNGTCIFMKIVLSVLYITKTFPMQYTNIFFQKKIRKILLEKSLILFLFCSKHRMWVHVITGEAVLTCTHNVCFERKYLKTHFFFPMKISIFALKTNLYTCILHGRVFVMYNSIAGCGIMSEAVVGNPDPEYIRGKLTSQMIRCILF